MSQIFWLRGPLPHSDERVQGPLLKGYGSKTEGRGSK